MPPLGNPRHERFAQEIAKGKSAADAYAAAGYRSDAKSSETAGPRLFRNVQVQGRVAELQSRAATRAVVTAADIARQLDEDREFAREVKQAGAAVSASLGKAKVLGLITEKLEHMGKGGGPIEYSDVRDRLTHLIDREATAGEAEPDHPTAH